MDNSQPKKKIILIKKKTVGSIRVGRKSSNYEPSYLGFTKIIVMMKSHSKWFPLSPYYLADKGGCIMENIYQAHKFYKSIPKTTQRYSQYDNRIIWDHPEEIHKDHNGEPNATYWNWRTKLMNNPEAVRYPVGRNYTKYCECSIIKDPITGGLTKLDYIQSRKQIYQKIYIELVTEQPMFNELLDRLRKGENLLIIEVDGPHMESLGYYQQKYGVASDFIVNNTMLATPINLDIMLNDPKHAYGHGYCLAQALLTKL